MLVPESELKWNRVHPEPDRFDFSGADWLADFARSHGMRFRGHALVYFQNEPGWVASASGGGGPARALRAHIAAVAGRYAGRVHSWDVVNEILELNDHRRDGLRRTPLLDRLGPDFVPLAFQAAAAADPKALLVWNENQLEYDVAYQEARREAVLRLLQGWRAAGVPIQALGIQSHLRQHATAFNANRYRAFLGQVAALGLKIIISELDVFDADLPADPAARDQAVAAAYTEYLSAALDEPAVIGVVTWGLSDRNTWLTNYRPRRDGAGARPLPLDSDLQPKPAWHAIARAFDGAPVRKDTG
jgi:endo-1,4-beta-xylanase